MAAITIDSDRTWVAARWVCDDLLAEVNRILPNSSAIQLSVQRSIDAGGDWLELTAFDVAAKRQFRIAVCETVTRIATTGPTSESFREGHEGFLARTRELLALLDASLAEAR